MSPSKSVPSPVRNVEHPRSEMVSFGGGKAQEAARNVTEPSCSSFLFQAAACTWSVHALAADSSGAGSVRRSGHATAWVPTGLASQFPFLVRRQLSKVSFLFVDYF